MENKEYLKLINEKSGLDPDYINAWNPREFRYFAYRKGEISEKEFEKILSKKIKTYEEYHKRQWPNLFEQTMEKVKERFLRRLNETVKEYNDLEFKIKKNSEIFHSYQERCVQILWGEIED